MAVRRSNLGSSILSYGILCAWGLFCLAPILYFLTIAFRPRNEINVVDFLGAVTVYQIQV